MTAPQPGRACPVDLDYPDPQPPSLDLAAVIGRGRRIRRRRRLTQLGAVLAACVAAGSVLAGVRGFAVSVLPSRSGPAAARARRRSTPGWPNIPRRTASWR